MLESNKDDNKKDQEPSNDDNDEKPSASEVNNEVKSVMKDYRKSSNAERRKKKGQDVDKAQERDQKIIEKSKKGLSQIDQENEDEEEEKRAPTSSLMFEGDKDIRDLEAILNKQKSVS